MLACVIDVAKPPEVLEGVSTQRFTGGLLLVLWKVFAHLAHLVEQRRHLRRARCGEVVQFSPIRIEVVQLCDLLLAIVNELEAAIHHAQQVLTFSPCAHQHRTGLPRNISLEGGQQTA